MTTKETYFFHRKISVLLKTLMPRYFRFGWRSRALGTEGQAFWAVLVVMATVSCTISSSTNCGLFSPNPLHFLFSGHRDDSRWQQGRPAPWPTPASLADMKEKGICFFLSFRVEWRPLLPLLCFQPRISEMENLRHQVINIQRIYFL